jgi:hypothetical protein
MSRLGWSRLLGVSLCLMVGLLVRGWADDQKKDDDSKTKKSLVAQKLDHAQKVLAAVAQTDYSNVVKHAEALVQNSKDLAWQQIRSDRYEELGKEYRRELDGLIKAAHAKNNDAMALAYVKVSLSCFNCHNHVREIKITGGGSGR